MKHTKIFLPLLILFLLVSCTQNGLSAKAQNGVLDLRNWDFSKNGNVSLDGQWEFYWQQLKPPEDFLYETTAVPNNYITVPSPSWSVYKENNVPVNAHGYATYRLQILLPKNSEGKPLALKLKDVATAYRLYVDDVLLVSVGEVGTSATTSKPRYQTPLRTFFPRSEKINIVVHVSNFHYAKSGLWESFRIGKEAYIDREKFSAYAYDLFLLGVLIIMFFYHLGLFFLRKKEISYLVFALFTFVFAIRVMTRGEIFLSLVFPNIPFAWEVKTEYLSFYFAILLFYWFLYFAFRGSFRSWMLKTITAIVAGFSLVVLFTAPSFFTKTINYFQLFSLVSFSIMLYGIYKAIRSKKLGATTIFVGTLLFAITAVNDILYLNGISPIPEISPFGSFLFILTQALVLFIQFAGAYKNTEILSSYLEKLRTANARFVPLDVLKFLEKESVVDIQLGDSTKKNMSILVSDIRNFTGISESMTPNQNFTFINSYLNYVSPVVRKYNGFIDAYLGDGILALFPADSKDALEAGIQIQKEIQHYNIGERDSLQKKIQAGIGIHSGSLMLGTIGEAQRLSATVVSDAVNTAFRLEILTKKFGVPVIVSEPIKNSASTEHKYRKLGAIRVKEQDMPISIYEVLDVYDENEKNLKLQTLELFETAVNFFSRRKYNRAKQLFTQVLQANPTDTATLYYLNFFERKKVG